MKKREVATMKTKEAMLNKDQGKVKTESHFVISIRAINIHLSLFVVAYIIQQREILLKVVDNYVATAAKTFAVPVS